MIFPSLSPLRHHPDHARMTAPPLMLEMSSCSLSTSVLSSCPHWSTLSTLSSDAIPTMANAPLTLSAAPSARRCAIAGSHRPPKSARDASEAGGARKVAARSASRAASPRTPKVTSVTWEGPKRSVRDDDEQRAGRFVTKRAAWEARVRKEGKERDDVRPGKAHRRSTLTDAAERRGDACRIPRGQCERERPCTRQCDQAATAWEPSWEWPEPSWASAVPFLRASWTAWKRRGAWPSASHAAWSECKLSKFAWISLQFAYLHQDR